MKDIRAFVGHSFLDIDSEVVAKFLGYFDRISKLHPPFSWEHAEAAEPKLLTEKVMALIANKNTFIGICTRKERVTDTVSLGRLLFQPEYRKIKYSELEWKTSDWIIQEIGMAKARGMEMVLLIEEGVRKPGGLQGDVEYISFNRASPEKSFNKILEMITALSPTPSDATGAPLTAASNEESKPTAADDDSWRTPAHDWDHDKYENAMFRAIASKDQEAADQINRSYLATADAGNGENRYVWEGRNEWIRILMGAGGSLAKIRTLAAEHPANAQILDFLAKGYEEYGNIKEAAGQYELAAKVAHDKVDEMRLMGLAAEQYERAGGNVKVDEIVEKLKIASANGVITELQLLHTLRNLAEIAKQDHALILAMERIVEITPEDTATRFSLAYIHSEKGNEDLALSNYLKIPFDERNRMVWNNLGATFDEFQLRGKSVDALRKSEAMGETLAMSNLANKLITIGMLKEAKEKCDQAIATKNYHKNITGVLSRLSEIPEEEKKKQDEILSKATPKIEFYSFLGHAFSRGQPNTVAKQWQGPDGTLELNLVGNKVTVIGQYEEDQNPLAAALAIAGAGRTKIKYRVEYSGIFRGHAMDGLVSRTKTGGPQQTAVGLLGIDENSSNVLMYLSEDKSKITIMENPHTVSPRIYVIKQSSPSTI